MDKLIKELGDTVAIFARAERDLDAAENADALNVPSDLYAARDDAGVDVARVAARLIDEINAGRLVLVDGQALSDLDAAREDVGRDVRNLIDALTQQGK